MSQTKSEEEICAPEIIAGDLDAGVVFVCDHASNAVPDDYGSLGLSDGDFNRHIAYDIGAAHVTRRLASLFRAPAVLTCFSRLLIDANRGLCDPTLVMRLSDGAIIPGNAFVDEAEIKRRTRRFWEPYRNAVGSLLDQMIASGPVPAIISIHSFTPAWKGRARPWQVGVLWDNDPRLSKPLIERLRGEDYVIGDNEPYDGALPGDTMNAFGVQRGLAHLLLELRQDLIVSRESADSWAERLAPSLKIVLAAPEAHKVMQFQSRTEMRHR